MLDERHALTLSELAKYTGQRVSWHFIKQTLKFIPQIDRFHNLITGIFKPVWSDYALSIAVLPDLYTIPIRFLLLESNDDHAHLDLS